MQLFVLITKFRETYFGMAEVSTHTSGNMFNKILMISLSNVQMMQATIGRKPRGSIFLSTTEENVRRYNDIVEKVGGVKLRGRCTVYHLSNGEKILVYT